MNGKFKLEKVETNWGRVIHFDGPEDLYDLRCRVIFRPEPDNLPLDVDMMDMAAILRQAIDELESAAREK